MVTVRFESAKWTAELGRAEGAFDALDCLVTDKSAVGVHLESGAAGKTAGMLAAGLGRPLEDPIDEVWPTPEGPLIGGGDQASLWMVNWAPSRLGRRFAPPLVSPC